jgi:hypothetical protein
MPFKPTDYLPYDFANRRHIGPSPAEMSDMLKMVGAPNLNALIDETLPESIRQKEPLDFGKPMSERELLYHMRVTASKKQSHEQPDWSGILWHCHTTSDPTEHSGKPCLVHSIYAVSARNLSGAT